MAELKIRSVWMLVVAATVAGLATAGPATGQNSLEDVLEPRITRAQLDKVIIASDLTRDQRMIAGMLYTDYDNGIQQLIADTDALADEYGRQDVQAAFAGRLHLPQAELNQKRQDVLSIFAEALPDADALLQNLLTSIDTMLMPSQRPAYAAEVRELRRVLLFEPLRAEELSYDYAGDGIDIVQLLGEAMMPDGELAGIEPQAVSEVVAWYERRLDAVLVRAFAAHRDAALQRRIANIARGADRTAEADEIFILNWKGLYELNYAAMADIAQIARQQLDDQAEYEWRSRFDAAVFPWLYRDRKPDRFIGWLDRDGAVSEEVDAKIRMICADYAAKKEALIEEATTLMLEARLDHGAVIHSMTDATRLATNAQRAIYQELLRNSGELSKLDADAVKAVETLLDDGERRSLDRYLRSSR